MSITNPYPHVYLSPHYDDASLSCGGAIHTQAGQGRPPLVITVFAAAPEPNQPLSPFAQALHGSWGGLGEAVAARQEEDRASMNILGADYVRLNLLDCIYRGRPEAGEWYYNGEADLFGPVHPADAALAGVITVAVTELAPFHPDTILYAPLAVGHHVDHQVVHMAAWQLHQQGWTVAFYEDYPYADPGYPFTRPINPWERPHTLSGTLTARSPAQLQARVRPLAEANLQAKIDSVKAYASQVAVLFGPEAALEHYLRQYALLVGAGQPAERVWLPGSSVTGPAPATGDLSLP